MSTWVVTLHRFETEAGGGGMRRHNEVARFDGDTPPAEVARFMERWYAEHYQPKWTPGDGIVEKATGWAGGDIDVGHEPKLGARLIKDSEPG